ncbi:TMF-regulated nuclear protein 1 [Mantella aurantiaca]
MPIVQGSALWNLQRVFNHPRSSKETETKDAKSVPSSHSSSSFWKPGNASSLFRFSSTPCPSPKRSASAPQGLPQKLVANPCTSASLAEALPTNESSISKSTSAPHTFTSKPNVLEIPVGSRQKPSTSDGTFSSPQNITSPLHSPFLSPSSLDSTSPNIAPAKPDYENSHEPHPGPSRLPDTLSSKPSPCKLPSSKVTPKEAYDEKLLAKCSSPAKQSTSSRSPSLSLRKAIASQSTPCRHASCSSSHSSPAQSPLKSPVHSSRRASTHGEQLPVTPSPPWSELMEARRRLMAVECRRRALCALEMRVQQVHYVFLQAEMRVARQKEGLVKLVDAAGRAEVQTAVHGQRIRKAVRHHKPRLLACALCVPWPSKTERRSVQRPRHSRCAVFQCRIQMLRGCVGSDELATRD